MCFVNDLKYLLVRARCSAVYARACVCLGDTGGGGRCHLRGVYAAPPGGSARAPACSSVHRQTVGSMLGCLG